MVLIIFQKKNPQVKTSFKKRNILFYAVLITSMPVLLVVVKKRNILFYAVLITDYI